MKKLKMNKETPTDKDWLKMDLEMQSVSISGGKKGQKNQSYIIPITKADVLKPNNAKYENLVIKSESNIIN